MLGPTTAKLNESPSFDAVTSMAMGRRKPSFAIRRPAIKRWEGITRWFRRSPANGSASAIGTGLPVCCAAEAVAGPIWKSRTLPGKAAATWFTDLEAAIITTTIWPKPRRISAVHGRRSGVVPLPSRRCHPGRAKLGSSESTAAGRSASSGNCKPLQARVAAPR